MEILILFKAPVYAMKSSVPTLDTLEAAACKNPRSGHVNWKYRLYCRRMPYVTCTDILEINKILR